MTSRALAALLAAFAGLASLEALAAKEDGHGQLVKELRKSLPVPGQVLCDGADLAGFSVSGDEDDVDLKIVSVAGQPFTKALRVCVAKAVTPAYKVQLHGPASIMPVRKGERLLVVFHVRCQEPKAGMFVARVQMNHEPWTGITGFEDAQDHSWRRIYVQGVADEDFGTGEVALTLHVGQQAQTLEFGGFVFLNLGRDVDPAKLPYTRLTYPGREKDAPWRQAAHERIERHRKGDLTVRVTDAAGNPVAGAQVHVQMTRHTYGFGSFIETSILAKSPDGEKYREWTKKLFNRATTPIYWADWGWANPEIRKDYHGIARWLQENHFTTRGHVLVYPGWHFLPKALRDLENDRLALRRRILDHVAEVVQATNAYGFDEYDVTNELRDLHDLTDLVGYDGVAEWFRQARRYNKTARLALNENTIFENGGRTAAQQDHFAQMIELLRDAQVGPDVLGMQGHFSGALTDPATVLTILDRFARYGKPIHITEFDLDIRDEEAQADYTRDFLTAIFSHPATEGFTQWGFWEGQHWRPQAALLRKDWTLKPNGRAYMDLVLRAWWTNVRGETSRDGLYMARGFLGDYQITVRAGGREQSVRAQLSRDGTRVTVVLE